MVPNTVHLTGLSPAAICVLEEGREAYGLKVRLTKTTATFPEGKEPWAVGEELKVIWRSLVAQDLRAAANALTTVRRKVRSQGQGRALPITL